MSLRKSRPFFATDTANKAVSVTTLLGQPRRVVSLKCIVHFDQRKNRRAAGLDIESDELILLRRPPGKLKRNETTRQNDRAAVCLAHRIVIGSTNELIIERPIGPNHKL